MDNKFELLGKDAIVSIQESDRIIMSHITFKVREFIARMRATLNIGQKWQPWGSEGVECEVLSPGKDWRKGKVRVTLEFLPDEPETEETLPSDTITEPESPLDDLRQRMNQENQQNNS